MAEARTPGQNWLVREDTFTPEYVRKYESILCQGNGYMGVRGATEEDYERTARCTLVAGTFDRAERKRTTELPNSADTVAAYLTADGIPFRSDGDNFRDYARSLNLYDGFLTRTLEWLPREGLRIGFSSERFVSLEDRHVIGQRITVKMLEGETEIGIETGIRGGERYGEPHFQNMESRLEGDILQYAETTHESGITFATGAWVTARLRDAAGQETPLPVTFRQEPNRIFACCVRRLAAGASLTVEKLCRIATTRDKDFSCGSGGQRETLLRREREEMGRLQAVGYEAAGNASARCWKRLWDRRDMAITGQADQDILAYRFAVYHLTIMAPLHDNRMNIGAKGLSGKGYFGHTFWDTEVYMLPYFIWTDPQGARSLLEYRYLCLDSARRNAAESGFEGARYPWESAWIAEGETCPDDLFSRHEYHVTADVAYGVAYYYEVTRDVDFMLRCGCEILFETAQFWKSRLEYNAQKDCYEILDVIGPDEFTHQANNNAFTNYLAHLNLVLAVQWEKRLKEDYPGDYLRLDQKLGLANRVSAWQERADKLVLPAANEQNILPQDDDFMTLPEIDLTIYRAGEKKLRKDYPYPTYTRLKVSKQADVMNLFLLREDLFPPEVKKASLDYYEPFCVHESSLSLCAYSMLAADCGEAEAAYGFFERARAIDLGPNMKSSDDGIHAASLGGIWQCCVLGFCGIRLCGSRLRIVPHLPENWESARVRIWWRGSQLEVTATHRDVTVRVLQGDRTVEVLTAHGIARAREVLSWQIGEEQFSR